MGMQPTIGEQASSSPQITILDPLSEIDPFDRMEVIAMIETGRRPTGAYHPALQSLWECALFPKSIDQSTAQRLVDEIVAAFDNDPFVRKQVQLLLDVEHIPADVARIAFQTLMAHVLSAGTSDQDTTSRLIGDLVCRIEAEIGPQTDDED